MRQVYSRSPELESSLVRSETQEVLLPWRNADDCNWLDKKPVRLGHLKFEGWPWKPEGWTRNQKPKSWDRTGPNSNSWQQRRKVPMDPFIEIGPGKKWTNWKSKMA
ncbi:hypothetical protein VTP01DRAFT_8415 [Rhizomucor pusillus]|uniref:uncharacterized protein n=1 Tax=Rhizomucor pusillus TaxID=4840 RepID=UPI0037420B1C